MPAVPGQARSVRRLRGAHYAGIRAELAAAMRFREPEARASSIRAVSVPAGRLFGCHVEHEAAGQIVGVGQNYRHNVTCFQRRRCGAGQRHHT